MSESESITTTPACQDRNLLMQAWMEANREVEAATTLVIAAARRLTDAEAAQAIAIKAVCAADWMPNLQAAAAAFVPDGPEEPGAIEATKQLTPPVEGAES